MFRGRSLSARAQKARWAAPITCACIPQISRQIATRSEDRRSTRWCRRNRNAATCNEETVITDYFFSRPVNPEFAGSTAGDEQGNKTINHGEFSLVHDREKIRCGMHLKVSHSHLAAGDESSHSREQSQDDQHAAYQLN